MRVTETRLESFYAHVETDKSENNGSEQIARLQWLG